MQYPAEGSLAKDFYLDCKSKGCSPDLVNNVLSYVRWDTAQWKFVDVTAIAKISI